jgi:hypothetical protein
MIPGKDKSCISLNLSFFIGNFQKNTGPRTLKYKNVHLKNYTYFKVHFPPKKHAEGPLPRAQNFGRKKLG